MVVDGELLWMGDEALRSNLIYHPVSHMEIRSKFTAVKDGTTFATRPRYLSKANLPSYHRVNMLRQIRFWRHGKAFPIVGIF
jgi:hypothetical protein